VTSGKFQRTPETDLAHTHSQGGHGGSSNPARQKAVIRMRTFGADQVVDQLSALSAPASVPENLQYTAPLDS
jgi:hypothetical protein